MQGATTAEQSLPCPRCESINTKFCYYNNYNLSQPRHFCKDCRRYWTRGGSLRNVPVGGGTRKSSKRASSAASVSVGGGNSKRPSPSSSSNEVKNPDFLFSAFPPGDNDHRMLDMTGSFSSLLSSTAQFGNFFECYPSLDSLPVLRGVARQRMETEVQSSGESSGNDGAAQPPPAAVLPESFVNLTADASGWAGGWPDLSIYTPGGSFQ